jgi:hypothetical protein
MNEQKTLKPIREVLRSRRFQKEIAILLTAFAVVQAIVSVLLFVGGRSDPENLVTVIAGLMAAIVYAVLAILIRFGSVSALVFTGILFTADTLLILFGPSSQGGVVGALFWRGFLIVLLIRFIQKARRANISEART